MRSDIFVNTTRCMDVDLTFFERYGRQMDVKTTLRAYWEGCYTKLIHLQNI